MTNDLSHDWQTDSLERGEDQALSQHVERKRIPIEAAAEEPENLSKTTPPFNPFLSSENHSATVSAHPPVAMMLGGVILGFTVMGTFLFLFFRGVLFLQANILSGDQASVAILEQGSSSSSENLANIPLPTLIAPSASSSSTSSSSVAPQAQPSSQPAAITQTPVLTIHVTDEKQATTAPALWPTSLKMNRYTVGSALVPDLSKVIPFPVFSVSKAEARMHPVAGEETTFIHKVPPTGPALWVLLALCLGVTPIFFVGRKGIMTA